MLRLDGVYRRVAMGSGDRLVWISGRSGTGERKDQRSKDRRGDGMKQASLASSFSGGLQVLVNMGLALVMVPVFIHKLGLPTYGIYALISAVGSVAFLTNFGFGTSLLKFLAEKQDRAKSNYDIAVTLIIVGVSTFIVSLVLLLN